MSTRSELYPDVVASGGLAALLSSLLSDEGLSANTEGPLFSATISAKGNHVAVAVGLEERSFHITCSRQGVAYASGWTDSLDEVVDCLVSFHRSATCEILGSSYPWLKIDDLAPLHELGAEEYVRGRWDLLLAGTKKDESLRLLTDACFEQSRLRELLPYLSHNRLCFSNTTGWPYSDCPCIVSLGDQKFSVQELYDDEGPSLAAGTAEHCAVFLVTRLPVHYGPAAHGTSK